MSVRFERWQANQEIEHLHQMDVGIMPLPADREWMRYKAATKLITYLAVGIPAVASPIGVNADILQGERVGFAAETTEQWFQRASYLALRTSHYAIAWALKGESWSTNNLASKQRASLGKSTCSMNDKPEISEELLKANPHIAVILFLFGLILLLILTGFCRFGEARCSVGIGELPF